MTASEHDDGTMDTVIACDECGEEQRYTYPGGGDNNNNQTYEEFVTWAIEDFEEEHECQEEDK